MKTILTIAGFDPSGCAGILVDSAVIRLHGFHPASVVTVVTYQNTCEVKGVYGLSPEAVGEQIRAVVEDLDVVGVKIGLVCSRDVSEEISRIVKGLNCPKVLDPVIVSTTGFEFSHKDVYEPLLKVCDVVTPNANEASSIAGFEVKDVETAIKACKIISERYGCSVVVTGGSIGGVDVVYSGEVYTVKGPVGEELRGTGCAYSSALTCNLAKGLKLKDACSLSREFMAKVANPVKVGRCFKILQVTAYHP